MRRIFAFCLLMFAFTMIVLADSPPKAEPKASVTAEEKEQIGKINVAFDLVKRDEQIAALKVELAKLQQQVLQEQFARIQAEVRLANNCPNGTLNPQKGEFTCPPPKPVASETFIGDGASEVPIAPNKKEEKKE